MRLSILVALPLLALASSCAKPDSIELGAACKDQVECKDPADTCLTVGTKSLCSLPCSAIAVCPEGYACAKMDVRVQTDEQPGAETRGGYCLAKSGLGPHVATIAPAKETGKGKGKGKGKSKKRKRATRKKKR